MNISRVEWTREVKASASIRIYSGNTLIHENPICIIEHTSKYPTREDIIRYIIKQNIGSVNSDLINQDDFKLVIHDDVEEANKLAHCVIL